ncbi:hypothetical protein L218DRAFT_878174 [Marasmius fiardii PR-910]|nr:hypothetical protein L218DRAFT_883028 [Marasmius fiardii PR-910]KAF9257988.1 hypothetical protein L218DRAFT_878174 [Marasmius fiardii PR-910]
MDSEPLEEHLAPFLSTQNVLVFPLSILSVMFLLYGLYIPFVGASARVLSRQDNTISKLFLGCVITLFILATLETICEATQVIRQAIIEFSVAKTQNFGPLVDYLQHDTTKTILS